MSIDKISRFLSVYFIVFFIPLFSSEKVLIFTYSYNRPDFIEIQSNTFKKFLKDDYEFVVFNDATDPSLYREIHQTCQKLDIACIDIPQMIHRSNQPSDRNGAVVDFSLKNLGFAHQGIVALFDSDLFLVKNFSIKDFMHGFLLGGVPQDRSNRGIVIDYLWVGLVFLDMEKLPNKETISFSPGLIHDVATDTGGFSHYYLAQNRTVPVRYFNQATVGEAYHHLQNLTCADCKIAGSTPCEHAIEKIKAEGLFDDHQIQYIINSHPTRSHFVIDSNFLHYSAGSNWNGESQEFHNKKTKILLDYIHSILYPYNLKN